MKKIIVLLIALIINLSNTADCATEKVFLTEEEIAREILFEKEPDDVREARTIAFKNVEYEIDPKTFEKYLKDKKFVAPPKEYGGKPKLRPRMGIVAFWSNDTYEVMYFNKMLHFANYIYSSKSGNLEFYIIYKINEEIFYTYLYDNQGKLTYIEKYWFEDGKNRTGYLFNEKKQWVGEWKNSILYAPNSQTEIFKAIINHEN